jgi:hypothetical protein
MITTMNNTHPAEAFVAACQERAEIAELLVRDGHEMATVG